MAPRFLESSWTPGIQENIRVYRGVKITFVVFWSMELCAVGGYPLLEANSASVNNGRIITGCTLNMEVPTDPVVSSSRLIPRDINFMCHFIWILGARGGVVVKALRYKPAGHGFDSRWCQDFSP